MGLMDILNGMQNGPHGGTKPSNSGGMSKMTMALIALLAWKALNKNGGLGSLLGGGQPQTAPANNRLPQGQPAPQAGGGLGDVLGGLLGNAGGGGMGGGALGGLLGGLLGGAAGGSILSGGLNDILKQLQDSGHGEVAKSWVGTGDNKPITPDALKNALGDDTVNSLAQQAGLSQVELLNGLSQQLPQLIDQLTPGGRVPSEQEAARML
jgi:uncharacterized protein YidB (DUF937 family)